MQYHIPCIVRSRNRLAARPPALPIHADNLAIFLAGGDYKHGGFVQLDENGNTPLSNLSLTMLAGMGIESGSSA